MFLANLVGFNLCWFGLVFFGNSFIPIAAAMLLAHGYYVSRHNPFELILIPVIAMVGICIDSFLYSLDVFSFYQAEHIPLWLMTLWFCFAATLCHSLGFLESSKWMQVSVGAFFAPLSYLAGFNLQVVEFSLGPLVTYLILAIIWGPLMVAFFHLKACLVNGDRGYA